MHLLLHILLCLLAGFFAIWATAINAMRWFEEQYSTIFLWIVSIFLMGVAFELATIHV